MTTTTTTAIIENRKRFSIAKLLLEGRAFLALVLIIVVFSLLSPNYLTWNNVLIMASHVAIYALLGMGMLLVILNGGIDLSVGSTLAFSAVIAGFLLRGVPIDIFGVTLYPSVPVTVLISCGVGALVGLVNGILVAKFKIAPFVATLGMLYAVRGFALLMTGGLTINKMSGSEELGNTGFDWLGFNRILGIPVGVLVMIAVALVLGAVLGRAKFGRWLYAAGGNERAAELSGVPTSRVKIWVYVISGLTAAIAGLVLASTLTSADPNAGSTYELTAIAAVVIGGAALTGGRGNVRGTLLGAFVIGFLSDGLVIIGVSAYWQMVFMGAVIVVAVMLNTLQYGRRRRPAPDKKSDKTPDKTPDTTPGETSNSAQTATTGAGSSEA
ncbi:sugar ABC transporter permease [Microbacterium sorbitolivorans]|uniref:ABC transporter permease n=1 Tax=Microbacterium sorbitolivorans TaxID=1867410 RepID=A0A367Y480_9MICO|nr:ABC transporter permease [Microbacterium sorbitolivorans]RCK59831.1 ABC transporter permease [Microbacterium sorbitolivorans]GGF40367.1 sugar ABC transporter permease [Microbacterium sorbitolivorans]